MVLFIIIMEICIKVKYTKEKNKEQEGIFIKMVINFKVDGKIIKKMGKAIIGVIKDRFKNKYQVFGGIINI